MTITEAEVMFLEEMQITSDLESMSPVPRLRNDELRVNITDEQERAISLFLIAFGLSGLIGVGLRMAFGG